MIDPMKALTTWQPWASLLGIGAKRYETRGWATSYRGPIAIHAAARKVNTSGMAGAAVYAMVEALRPITAPKARTTMHVPLETLPRGAIIATAELVECWKMTDEGHTLGGARAVRIENVAFGAMPDGAKTNIIQGNELLFGDWTPGRYAWEFANVQLLPEPIPANGKQGLWNWGGSA